MSVPPIESLLDLTGQVVLVTGSSKGIGAGISMRFAEAGALASVHCLTDRAGAETLRDQINQMGKVAVVVQGDVTKREDVERIIARTIDSLGRLDVLINNAGSYPVSPLLDMQDDEWDEVVNSNLRGTYLCTQVAARAMKEQSTGGTIINIASIEAENPASSHAHYVAAKAGVVRFTEAAANELGQYGIRVNCVSPGLIWREGLDEAWPEGVEGYLSSVPLGRLGYSVDVADACLFLASAAARWITGVNLRVDGGVLTSRVF